MPSLMRRPFERPFLGLEKSMNEVFGDFMGDFFRNWSPMRMENVIPTLPETVLGWNPHVDLSEDDKNIYVTAELPGVDEKAVEVTYRDGMLAIKGEKKEEKEEKKKNWYRTERTYGVFQRAFTLPCAVEAEKITAAYKHGVLNITAPKTVEAVRNVKKIDVRPG